MRVLLGGLTPPPSRYIPPTTAPSRRECSPTAGLSALPHVPPTFSPTTPAPRRACAAGFISSPVHSERWNFLLVRWNRLLTTKPPDYVVRASLQIRSRSPPLTVMRRSLITMTALLLAVRPLHLVRWTVLLSVETAELWKTCASAALHRFPLDRGDPRPRCESAPIKGVEDCVAECKHAPENAQVRAACCLGFLPCLPRLRCSRKQKLLRFVFINP